MLESSAKAPSFTLPTDAGIFKLADHHGKKMVVFFSRGRTHQAAPKKRLPFQRCKMNLTPPIVG